MLSPTRKNTTLVASAGGAAGRLDAADADMFAWVLAWK
nr:hypothetical protein BDOA9_0206530 [Bradyrhizobium sp. DOA9]